MKQYTTYEAHNLKEVEQFSSNLDVASLVPISFNDNGVIKNVTKFNGIYNNSKGEFCNIVTLGYKLIQHREYINACAAALDRLGLKYSLTLKPTGHKVYADIEFEGMNHKFTKLNEEFVCGLRLVNSYNKTTGIGVAPRFKRLACMNGMIVTSQGRFFSVKHTSKLLEEMEKFIELRINSVINEYDSLQQWVSDSMRDSIEWLSVTKIINSLITQAKHKEEILKRLNIATIIVKGKDKKKTVTYTFDSKKEKINRWDIYNAVTHYLTHGENITPVIESYYQKSAEKILLNPLQTLMPVIK